jgi:hypothetical protein
VKNKWCYLKIALCVVLVVSSTQSRSMESLSLQQFDALRYLQQIPNDVHTHIRSQWYHQNPMYLHIKPYAPAKATTEYPWMVDESGFVTVRNNTTDRSMTFGLNGAKQPHITQISKPIDLCGPDNNGTLCFVDNQLWVIPTGERFFLHGSYSKNGWKTAQLCGTKIKTDSTARYSYADSTPRALAANGSRCIISTKLGKLWLCDIIMPTKGITINFATNFEHAGKREGRHASVKKICYLGLIFTNPSVCMPSSDTAVIYDDGHDGRAQTVHCVHYTQGEEPSINEIHIPAEYTIKTLHCVDTMPHKFVLDMVSSHCGRALGIWSTEPNIAPLFVPLYDLEGFRSTEFFLPIAPNRSTRQKVVPGMQETSSISMNARSPEDWDAYLALRAAQQLHEKEQWSTFDKDCASTILTRMWTWEDELSGKTKRPNKYAAYPAVNPYYFYWLARTKAGGSNYFRDLYYRMHAEKVTIENRIEQEQKGSGATWHDSCSVQ